MCRYLIQYAKLVSNQVFTFWMAAAGRRHKPDQACSPALSAVFLLETGCQQAGRGCKHRTLPNCNQRNLRWGDCRPTG